MGIRARKIMTIDQKQLEYFLQSTAYEQPLKDRKQHIFRHAYAAFLTSRAPVKSFRVVGFGIGLALVVSLLFLSLPLPKSPESALETISFSLELL